MQALAIGVPELGGIIIAVSIRPDLPWYKSLDKPVWAPPGTAMHVAWATRHVLCLTVHFPDSFRSSWTVSNSWNWIEPVQAR